jgi:hypothetical protein
VIEHLPQSLRDIASAIGFESVMRLVDRYGSQRLWIPVNPSHDWELFDILGREASFKLVGLCGGNQIDVPSCKTLKIEMRNQKIRDDRRSLSIEKLAAKYGLRREWIRRICKG